MYAVTNRIKIQPGNGADLESQFAKRGSVQNEPGFKSFELWSMEIEDDHEVYLAVTRWEDKSDFLNWTKSESFKESHAGPHPTYILEGGLASYEVKISLQKG